MAKQERRASHGNSVLSRLDALAVRMRHFRTLPRLPWVRSWKSPLPAIVTAWGVERRIAPTHYDWHGLKRGSAEFVLFQYTLAGEGMLTYEGATRPVRPGQALVLFFPHDNRYWLPPQGDWEFFFLCLSGAEVVSAVRETVRVVGPLIDLAPDSRAVVRAANTCSDILGGKLSSVHEQSARAYGIAMALLEHAKPDAPPIEADPQLARAVEYCREHLAEDIGVNDMAKAAGYSRYHFTRLFKAAYRATPNDFLVELRVSAAAQLLRDGDRSVKDVAAACGYADPAYFCKVFRRSIGVSPGVFRDSGMYGG